MLLAIAGLLLPRLDLLTNERYADTQSGRRPPAPKAWTSSINPITQKATQPQPNGNTSQQSTTTPKGGSKLTGVEKDANDRLNFILGASTVFNLSSTYNLAPNLL